MPNNGGKLCALFGVLFEYGTKWRDSRKRLESSSLLFSRCPRQETIAGCGLHDPLAVAVAEDPSLARTERMFVDVELHGEFTRGQTIADRRLTAVARHNADVCMDINRPRFLANFLAAIKGR